MTDSENAASSFDPDCVDGWSPEGPLPEEESDQIDMSMLSWLHAEHQGLTNLVSTFASQQQRSMDDYVQAMDQQLSQQRVQMLHALSGCRRDGEASRQVDPESPGAYKRLSVHWAVPGSQRSLASGHDVIVCDDVILKGYREAYRARSPLSASPSSGSSAQSKLKKPVSRSRQLHCSLASLSPRFSSQRSAVSERSVSEMFPTRASIVERSQRLQTAYEDAAKKMQDKNAITHRFTRIQETIEMASSNESLLQRNSEFMRRTRQMVEGNRFRVAVACLVLLNVAFIGLTSEISMRRSLESYDHQSYGDYADITRSSWIVALDVAFNLIFLFELVLRILCLEGRFCVGTEWRWNLFDTVLVILSVTEMLLSSGGLNASFIRIIRFLRIVRSLRMLRIMRYTHLIRKLRMMTLAIQNCSMMLMWAVLVLFIVIFLFSVVFLNAASQHISDSSVEDTVVVELRLFFGSLFMTMVTMFMSVAGGLDWWDVLQVLLEISVGYAVLYMLFVIITVLAVLNVINAIFVNDAMESTRMDHDLRMQGELEETKLMVGRLTAIFGKFEVKFGTDSIMGKDFVEHVERQDVKMQFALLGLHYTDGLNFFKLLDIDGNSRLSIEEFVMGCLRLKGGGLLIDSNVLIQETKELVMTTARANKKAIAAIASTVKDMLDRFNSHEVEMMSVAISSEDSQDTGISP